MALLRYPVLPNFRCRIVSLQASDTATQKQLVDRSIDPAKDLEVCNTPLSPLIKSHLLGEIAMLQSLMMQKPTRGDDYYKLLLGTCHKYRLRAESRKKCQYEPIREL